MADDQRGSAHALGCRKRRAFFPHRVRFLPRASPDALYKARRWRVVRRPSRLWTVLVYVEPPTRDELPSDLYFDDDLAWHRQHLGQPGHVALGSAAVQGSELVVLEYLSDVAQRASRVPEYRTRIRSLLGGWPNLTVHALVHLGIRLGLDRLRSPTSDRVLSATDPTREPGPDLFRRVYDRTLERDFGATRRGGWWHLDLHEVRSRALPLLADTEPIDADDRPTVCIVHDIERGVGHVRTEPAFAREAEIRGWSALERMLEIEAAAGVPSTYSVVGSLWDEAMARIGGPPHEVAFHSYDHGRRGQLLPCRRIDVRPRGYRPPQSRLTWEHRTSNLVLRNFDWFASSEASLGVDEPELRNRLVRVPIALDDYPLHTRAMEYDAWERRLMELVEQREFVAVGLHDCYGDDWLDRYPALLARLTAGARLRRVGDVADELFLAAAS
ncbi:MAG: hypothetical protein KJP18_02500 [Gemmatimonadetes bacterium]|nr:hypothetical protein [Gemmatimonadota bacterium]